MPPGDSVSVVSNAARTALPDSGSGDALPDVVIKEGKECSVSAEKLEEIRNRARKTLAEAYSAGFGHLPIDREVLVSRTLPLLTESAICSVLMTPSGAGEGGHNAMRREFSGSTLSSADARSRGFLVSKAPLKISCPPKYDWMGSPFYIDVESCGDVTDEFPGFGMPAMMYATRMPAADAAEQLSVVSKMVFYSKYAGAGPVMCKTGANYEDAYHEIWVSSIWPNLKFVMRGIHGKFWAAWKLLRSCMSGADNLSASDLMFNFGARVFIPVDVDDNGRRDERTVVMAQMMGASNSPFAIVLTENFKLESAIGREFAKKLFLEAKEKGWKLER